MLENNLAEELSRPVIPSDVHSGSLDPDPLPQDSKEHHFQTIKTSKKTLLIKNGYPIDELIGRACSSTKSSAPEFGRQQGLGGVILPNNHSEMASMVEDGLTLEITSSSDYR
jgi:hypothetical protein